MVRIELHGGDDGPGGAAVRGFGKVFVSLVFAMFLVAGLFFVGEIAKETRRALETRGWASQPATILSAGVETRRGETPYVPVVTFAYSWNGERRESATLSRGDVAEGDWADAAARLAPYTPGATVRCFVGSTGEAVLEHASAWGALFLLLPLVFVAVGAGGLWATWRPRRRDAAGRPAADPISDGAARFDATRGMAITAGVIGLIGAGLGTVMVVRPAIGIWEARHWAAQACVVERSAVRAHRSDDGTTYSIDILYRYERGGRVHRSSRYSFFGGSTGGRAGKAAVVAAHPPGHAFTCFVDPADPTRAVIERGPTTTAWFGLIPVALLVGAGLLGRHAHRRRTRRTRLVDALGRAGRGPAPDDPVLAWLPDFDLARGPVRLAAETTRARRLLGIVFATVFWNGIVAVFAHQARESFERGRPEWGLTVFLVPFVLVGIGLCFAIVYEAMRATNARAEIHADRSPVALGETLEIAWRLSGRLAALRRLVITLEGREAATYRRGSSSHTAHETFASITLVDLVDRHRMARGRAAVTLPRDTLHSFEGGDNAIQWALRLRGEIDRWPDIDERHPLVVWPLPPDEAGKHEEDAP